MTETSPEMMERKGMDKMRTATEALQMASAVTREASVFRDRVEHFIRHWAPSDPRECAEFVADFMTIQRQMYLDAISPDRQMVERMLRGYANSQLVGLKPPFAKS